MIDSELLTPVLPDFSDPLSLINSCHLKLKKHCEILVNAVNHFVEQQVVSTDFDLAIKQVTRYFSTAAKLHHMDEEEDIFPLVIDSSVELTDLVHKLETTHRQLDTCWQALTESLDKNNLENNPQLFIEAAKKFVKLNLEHLKLEEESFFPVVQPILTTEQLATIGKSMAERRNIKI